MYLDTINMLLDTYAPLKRINRYRLKPWITLGLHKSRSAKNKLLVNFINKKDPILKEEFHSNYKNIEIYSINRVIMINILKQTAIILRTH